MPRIYIAGPLMNGHTTSAEVGYENAKKVFTIAEQLMQKGWSPYIPHLSIYMWDHIKQTQHRDIPWEEWMQLDSAFINVCQAIFFVGHSKGADRELKYAIDHDLKVYVNIDEVPKVPAARDLLEE